MTSSPQSAPRWKVIVAWLGWIWITVVVVFNVWLGAWRGIGGLVLAVIFAGLTGLVIDRPERAQPNLAVGPTSPDGKARCSCGWTGTPTPDVDERWSELVEHAEEVHRAFR